jgi:hypothetical protein
MRFTLLSEEILLQFGFGVGEEVDVFALGVDEKIACEVSYG